MTKKTLEALFSDNAVTNDSLTTVSSEFYHSTLPKGVTKDQADKVNAHNTSFLSTSLKAANDVLVAGASAKDSDGATVIFETGTEGLTFNHTVNPDESSDSGFDIFSSIDNDLGAESELSGIYASLHEQLTSIEEADEEDE